jgi:hypothetical protein
MGETNMQYQQNIFDIQDQNTALRLMNAIKDKQGRVIAGRMAAKFLAEMFPDAEDLIIATFETVSLGADHEDALGAAGELHDNVSAYEDLCDDYATEMASGDPYGRECDARLEARV